MLLHNFSPFWNHKKWMLLEHARSETKEELWNQSRKPENSREEESCLSSKCVVLRKTELN